MADNRLFTAEQVSEAVASAAKEPERFLTATDVEDIAAQVGVPIDIVRRELERPSARTRSHHGPAAFETADSSLTISVAAPGLRPCLLVQLLGVLAAGAISSHWLAAYPYFVVAALCFWIIMIGKIVAISLRRATLAIGEDATSIQISGWSGGESHKLAGGRDLQVSVERAGDRMPIEFFPMYFLSLRAGGHEVKALHGHSSETLDSVRQAIGAWQQRRPGAGKSAP